MKNIIQNILLTGLLIVFAGCSSKNEESKEAEADSTNEFPRLYESATTFFAELPSVAENTANPITPEKVELGKKLYFDVRLSKDNSQSCNTCHNLATFGVDNKPLSVGNNGGFGDRNSPTTLNAALHVAQFWDGREPHVEAQAGGPILNPVEMAMASEKMVVDRLAGIDEYVDLFVMAFPDDPNPVTYDNLKKAIGAFERELITPSRFDDYLAGNLDALNTQEKEGLQTFINTGCTTCHPGSLLGGNMYQKFGLMDKYWEHTKSKKIDEGRFTLTNNEADKYMFKVPSLRNVEKTYPYFHDGSVENLEQSIRIMAKIQLNKDLTDKEVGDIAAFLGTLTGKVPEELVTMASM